MGRRLGERRRLLRLLGLGVPLMLVRACGLLNDRASGWKILLLLDGLDGGELLSLLLLSGRKLPLLLLLSGDKLLLQEFYLG